MARTEPSRGTDEILDRLELFGIRMGLTTSRTILAALGSPEEGLPVVLVGGTNGKGSTSALLAAMASAAGYRTGLYTSPHLEEVRERVRIDGRAIADEALAAALRRVVEAAEETLGAPPTYFEALTVAALLLFAEARVDLAVLEVGLGGRLDSTNVTDPLLSVVTPIGLDHQKVLGDSLGQIAREKAGIFRAGRPAVVWPGSEEAREALTAEARRIGAELVLAPEQVTLEAGGDGGEEDHHRQSLTLGTGVGEELRSYRLSLRLAGQHQGINAALAVLAAEALAARGFPRLDRRAIEAGAAACRWPGRMEYFALPSNKGVPPLRVLLDAAHNPAGAAVLADHLRRLSEPFHLLFGCFRDKDSGHMLPPLAELAHGVTLTTSSGERGRPPEDLVPLVPPHKVGAIEADQEAALDAALTALGPAAGSEAAPRLLVVTGSIYLLGVIRESLTRRFGVPAPASAPLYSLGSDPSLVQTSAV